MGCLCIYHPDIEEFIEAKSWDKDKLTQFNLSVMVDDDFMFAVENDENIFLHYPCMDEKGNIENDPDEWIIKKEVRARDLWNKIMTRAYNYGEPGVLFIDNFNRDNNLYYMENIVTTNPCFTGDMKLLTDKGYKTFEELCDNNVNVISYDGQISSGKVWCTGEKETIKLNMSNNKKITCTPNHKFMTLEGEECEAKDLLGKKIMPKIYKTISDDELFIKLGFIQGDGQLSRLNSKYHNGVEVNIGYKDGDVRCLFERDSFTVKSDRAIYLNGYNDILEKMGFSKENLPYRILPTSYPSWELNKKASFLQGCFSANGCVNSNKRISYKTTCKTFAEELVDTLEKDFGITANITTNKKHISKFENGEYECRESYDININKYEDILIFAQYIGFYQTYKKIKLQNLIVNRVPYVRSIKDNGKQLVYDFREPINHWGIVEGFVAHNCGEYVSGILDVDDGKEYMGACNLGSLFLHNYVENPFTENAYFDFDKLKKVIPIAVRMLDNIIDINYYPLEAFENYQKSIRTIGLGITGLHDMLWMLGYDYSSVEACQFVGSLMEFIVYHAYCASVDLAKEKGAFKFFDKKFADSRFIMKHIRTGDMPWDYLREDILKYGIRNGRLISVAPVGTLSLTFGENCSSGLEPVFDLEYDRVVKVGGQEEKNEKKIHMIDYAYDLWKNTKNKCVNEDVFKKTALNLSVEAHVSMLNTIAYHVDMSCSKTINIPTETTFDKTKELFYNCWRNGIKGVTIFRPNELRQGILLSDKNKSQKTKELQRGEWSKIPSDTIYKKCKIHTGCGKLVLFVGYSPSEDRIVEMYVKRSANGGCVHNIDALVISMSGMLRLGGNLDNIEKAFRGCGTCNSFTTAKLKGNKLSKGKSCPTAILNAIKEVESEIKTQELAEIISNTPELKTQLENEYDKFHSTFTEAEKAFIEENGQIAYANATNRCPVCNSELQNSGGCISCSNCGFSRCE